jgi:hypothetical protein
MRGSPKLLTLRSQREQNRKRFPHRFAETAHCARVHAEYQSRAAPVRAWDL